MKSKETEYELERVQEREIRIFKKALEEKRSSYEV